MTPPSRPTASLAPVCSGCQCVLISVWMRLLPVALLTAASSASALAARPPSIISAPSGRRASRSRCSRRPGAASRRPDRWSRFVERSAARWRDTQAAARRRARRAGMQKRVGREPADVLKHDVVSEAAPLRLVTQSVVGLVDRLMNLATHPAARCPPRRPAAGPGPATRGFEPSVSVAPSSRSSAASSL